MVAAMLALTAVISVVMLQFDWNGDAASAEAADIDTLTDVMIVLSSFVYSIVVVMLAYSVWRYRAKPGDESDGEPIHGNTRLEIAWTLIPTVIVLGAAAYSWVILDDIEAREPDRLNVNVTAQQFAWRFEYPEQGVTSTELHVPVDRQVEFSMEALDVIHSFWVPEWRMKKDLVPGLTTHITATPNEEGNFALICTELCGIGHATMRAPVIVESQEEFDSWLSKQEGEEGAGGAGGPAGEAEGAEEDLAREAQAGESIFSEQGCSGCHTLAAAGSTADVGPSLDESIPQMSPEEIEQAIVDPDSELAEGFGAGIMPDTFGDSLDEEQLASLVAYLQQSAGGGSQGGE
jgi:cytochrome c oxidase subunit 2